jgi:hypothetical protein
MQIRQSNNWIIKKYSMIGLSGSKKPREQLHIRLRMAVKRQEEIPKKERGENISAE